MDKALRPERPELNPRDSSDGKNNASFTHWSSQYLDTMKSGNAALSDKQKYSVLINHVNSDNHTCINQFDKYSDTLMRLLHI